MLTSAQRHAILARISSSRILALSADLEALDRLFGGPGLDEAGQRMHARLEQAGATRAELTQFPSGPEHRYFGWSEQRRPFPRRAELWLQTPDDGEILICRRSDNIASCMGAFRSTELDGEVLEVVDVGFGTRASDYRGRTMAGKLALASGHHFQAAMLEALGNRQAAGLLCGPGSALYHPGRVVHNQLGDPALFDGHRPFGFNLSGRQYNRLVNLLAAGESVKMRAAIRVATDTGSLPVVSAVLEGSDLAHQRVLLVAGLDSPLGPACLEEVLRTVSGLVVDGQCAPPRRTLEILLVPQVLGTVARLHQLGGEGLAQLKAALYLSLDSPAAAARVRLQHPPATCPSFHTDLLEDQLRWASTVEGSYRTDTPMTVGHFPYSPGSPTLPFVDRDVGLPAVWIRCQDEEPGSAPGGQAAPHGPLHRVVAALSCAALELCALDGPDLPRLLCGSHVKAQVRLGRRAEQLRDRVRLELHQDDPSSTAGRHLLWRVETSMKEGLRQEEALLHSCCDYLDGPGQHALRLAEVVDDLEQATTGLVRSLHREVALTLNPRARLALTRRPLTALERRADAVVTRRLFAGPLPERYLLRDAGASERAWLAHNAGALAAQPATDEVVQWIDGERTLLQMFDLIRLDHPQADLKLLWRLLEVLASAGLVELREEKGVEQA